MQPAGGHTWCVCLRARTYMQAYMRLPACGCVNACLGVDSHRSVGVSQVLSQPVSHTLPFLGHLGLENWGLCPPLVHPGFTVLPVSLMATLPVSCGE